MSSLASILLVESNTILSQKLVLILHQMSATITQCFTITEAFKVIDLTRYDLVIVSREMSDGDGIEVAEYLNETALSTKILVISAQKISLQDKILAYKAGASDFLSKPIEILEFKYKISALLQLQKILPNKLLQYASIKLNPNTGTLYLGDQKQTHLRKKESAILTCLLRHRPKIVTKSMIIDYVWGESNNMPTHSTVDVYIRRLRSHMGSSHHLIKTARGYGYYLAE